MDEISSINSENVFITSRFFMATKPVAAGAYFTLTKSYSSLDSSVFDVTAIASLWEATLRQEVIGRLIYSATETVNNSSFKQIKLAFSITEDSELDFNAEGAIADSVKIFSFTVKFTAVEAITPGAVLRL